LNWPHLLELSPRSHIQHHEFFHRILPWLPENNLTSCRPAIEPGTARGAAGQIASNSRCMGEQLLDDPRLLPVQPFFSEHRRNTPPWSSFKFVPSCIGRAEAVDPFDDRRLTTAPTHSAGSHHRASLPYVILTCSEQYDCPLNLVLPQNPKSGAPGSPIGYRHDVGPSSNNETRPAALCVAVGSIARLRGNALPRIFIACAPAARQQRQPSPRATPCAQQFNDCKGSRRDDGGTTPTTGLSTEASNWAAGFQPYDTFRCLDGWVFIVAVP
jgi:hypothetical protein